MNYVNKNPGVWCSNNLSGNQTIQTGWQVCQYENNVLMFNKTTFGFSLEQNTHTINFQSQDVFKFLSNTSRT